MSKFFTYEERLTLQKGLKENQSLKSIARQLGKDPTTVSREVKKYASDVATGCPGYPYNACKNRMNCRKKEICGRECSRKSIQYCKLCRECNERCSDFVLEICSARFRPPYVCNACEKISKCTLMKTIYDAEHAHLNAHNKISESRSGLCVSEEEIARLKEALTKAGVQI